MKISHCEDHLVSRTRCFEPNTGNWYFPLVYLKKKCALSSKSICTTIHVNGKFKICNTILIECLDPLLYFVFP